MRYEGDIAQGLVDDILEVIHRYDEAIMLPTVIGCLEIVKQQLITDAIETTGEDEE